MDFFFYTNLILYIYIYSFIWLPACPVCNFWRGQFSDKKRKTKLRIIVKKVSERIYDIPDFDYYALADGIKEILTKSYTGIASFLKSYYQKRRSHKHLRLSLPLWQ